MTIDKKLLDTLSEPNTIVIIQDGGVDSQIAERWLEKHAPKVVEEQRVYTELHLPHLQAPQSVCAVFRSPKTPAVGYVVNQQGSLVSFPRPDMPKGDDPGTFSEVVVTKPIKVGDYWQRTNTRAPGAPDRPAFMQALQETLIPLRLDFADKGEAKPEILALRTL
jgi:hypothetical protein